MDKTVFEEKIAPPLFDLKHYEAEVIQLDQLKASGSYDRITIHDVNNSLSKINNALWLMAREENTSTPLFHTCRQIVEREIKAARNTMAKVQTAIS